MKMQVPNSFTMQRQRDFKTNPNNGSTSAKKGTKKE